MGVGTILVRQFTHLWNEGWQYTKIAATMTLPQLNLGCGNVT